jgi:signal transduction histidine kinase
MHDDWRPWHRRPVRAESVVFVVRRAARDEAAIELIVLNLAINARDAMPSGSSLTLETFNAVIDSELSRPEDPAPGDYVGLAVNDTGVGIADDVLPRIFEPFFTTKEPGKGSGTSLRFRQTIGRQRAYRDTRRRGHPVKVFVLR